MNAPDPRHARPWLSMQGVSLRLGGRLFLRDFDWEIREDERWAILGPNGAGKTVLAQLVGGMLHPGGGQMRCDVDNAQTGWVSFELQKALCEDDARHDISEFMENAADAGTTLRALLAQVAASESETADAVRRLGLGALLDRGLRFLSSGEMRRALLARALLQKPRLLILDNPYEGIDADSRRLVHGLIEQWLASPMRVLMISRRIEDISERITHVLAMEQGRVIARGPRQALMRQLLAARNDAGNGELSGRLPPPMADTETTPTVADEALIELREVHAHYGDVRVLDGLSLRLGAGEHLCIAGPNGCGKSTLLSLICGDNPRAYGQDIRLFGRRRGSGESVWDIKQRFGIVSNQLHLGYPKRSSAFDVVASGFFDSLGLYDRCGPRQIETARAWLALLGLSKRARNRFDELSFGEQRMMLIARAMVKSPRVLILDEPCSGLDAPNRARVLALVERIAERGGTQLLYVSHEAEEMPACITRRLEFRRDAEGNYRLLDSGAPPGRTAAGD